LEWDGREAAGVLQAKAAILQDLFPSGLAVVADVLAREVDKLAGNRSEVTSKMGLLRGLVKSGATMIRSPPRS
jgi:hypothetical protein